MKNIRECRMGPPKSYKTGAVVGSYPKPMLYLGFDRGGLDVVPTGISPRFDVQFSDIEFIKPGVIRERLAASTQPKILAVDYTLSQTVDLETTFAPAKAQKPFQDFVNDYNIVSNHIRTAGKLPWQTVVLDSVTGYEDIILNFISSFNPNAMSDARQWAGQCGGKVRQTILTLTTWPCHVVVIMHSMIDKNETTGMIVELPSVFSAGLRTDMGGLFSQFFYAVKVNGTPKIWPHDQMFVRGVGARWPQNLPKEMEPDFKSIYGTELT